MSVGSEVLICGQYTVTYAGTGVGIMEGDAGVPTIEQVAKAEAIDSTDKYGKTTIDHIYQGADWFAQFTCEEYKAGSLAAFWPFGALGVMGVIGRLNFSLSAALVLTAVTGTPAQAVGSPNSLTATNSLLAPGFNGRLLYGPTLRKVPIRLMLYPYILTGSTVGWFTQT